MKTTRKLATALVWAAIMASATIEAKKPGPPGPDPVCSYLATVITYEYVTPTIQAYALALFSQLGCDPALLQ